MDADHKIIGLEIGEVTELEKDSYRVKVTLPAWSEEETSNWVPVSSFMAGPDMGWFCLPNVGDKVVVGFHQGNRHEPYILGALWTEKKEPPQSGQNPDSDRNKDGKNLLRYLKTQSGHLIVLDDTEKKEKIQIVDKSGNKKIEMLCGEKDEDNQIVISNTQGNMTIEAPAGSITIKCKQLEIEATETLTMKAGKKISVSGDDEIGLEASKDLKLSGSNVVQEAQQNVQLKGSSGIEAKAAKVNIESSTTMALKAGAVNEIKGAMVKIN